MFFFCKPQCLYQNSWFFTLSDFLKKVFEHRYHINTTKIKAFRDISSLICLFFNSLSFFCGGGVGPPKSRIYKYYVDFRDGNFLNLRWLTNLNCKLCLKIRIFWPAAYNVLIEHWQTYNESYYTINSEYFQPWGRAMQFVKYAFNFFKVITA